MPKISVIVPVYRAQEWLPRCIDSMLAQTFKDFELLLIDDCSPDKSGEIADAYAEKDTRVRVIHCAENGGSAAARDKGIAAAKGAYIGFLDSDDWVEPTMYETLFALLQKHNADVAECSFFITTDQKETPAETGSAEYVYDKQDALRELHSLKRQHDVLWNKLCRSEIVKNTTDVPRVIIGEDYSMVIRFLEQSEKYVYAPLPLYHYYQHGASVCNRGYSDKHPAVRDNWLAQADRLCREYPAIAREVRAKILFQEMSFLAAMAKNKNYDKPMMKAISADVRRNFFTAMRAKGKTATAVLSMCLTVIHPRLVIWLYALLHKGGV